MPVVLYNMYFRLAQKREYCSLPEAEFMNIQFRWGFLWGGGGGSTFVGALQRQNIEISKQIFPEKEYRGLSPNFHIHASVSDLYNPTISLPILLEEICRPIVGLNRSQTHECWNWGWGRAIPRKGIHKGDFRCSGWLWIARRKILSQLRPRIRP